MSQGLLAEPPPEERAPQPPLPAELAQRDLSFLGDDGVRLLKAAFHGYFRAEVEGMDRIPAGPVLFVGNHSGGNGSPDSAVFILEYLDRFGIDAPLYWLGHSLIMRIPVLGDLLRRCGVIEASPPAAITALRAGASVVVYPGGDVELHRPWWERNVVNLRGHQGFLRIARQANVPIVPVVATGGHNTYFPLTSGKRIARTLRLDKAFKLKVFPISIALPWGLNVGDFFGHLPLPAKIRVQVLPPVDITKTFGDDIDAAYSYIRDLMQQTADDMVEHS